MVLYAEFLQAMQITHVVLMGGCDPFPEHLGKRQNLRPGAASFRGGCLKSHFFSAF